MPSDAMPPDPYAPYLRQAEELFARDEIVKAGQIWQAILKQQPAHTEARERLVTVRKRLLALQGARPASPTAPEPAPAPRDMAPPEAPAAPAPLPAPAFPAAAAPAPVPAFVPAPIQAPISAPVQATSPATSQAPASAPVEPSRLVLEGCTLYDMGQLQDALHKWEQVLALDPGHALARGYANGARRELGLPPLQAPVVPVPADSPIAFGDDDVARLLREAIQLYDMGLTEEAISKWERVLVLEPHRDEIRGYLRQARQEVIQSALSPAMEAAPTVRAAVAEAEALDLKLRQADHLLTLQRHEEAAFTYQQALSLSPGHPRALEGLERCRRPAGHAQVPGPGLAPVPIPAAEPLASFGHLIAMVEEEPLLALPDPTGVAPPASLLKVARAPRGGLSLPGRLQGASDRLPWLKSPKVLAALGGGLLVLILGFAGLRSYRKDQELKEAVKAARTAAVAPVLQQAQAPDLAETPADIREEAEAALDRDPLRAYLRAQTLVARHPGEAAGPQLLEKARAGLAGGATGASLPEFQKHLQNGDLETAAKVMDALLRAQPDEMDLRTRAARLQLLLCSAHAGQAKWDAATEDLRRGRALFPGDKTWQSRLKLLECVKTLPKAQQAGWIPLLG